MSARLGELSGFVPFLFLAGVVLLPRSVPAAEAVGAKKADDAVREALQREIYGLAEDRNTLLKSAVDEAPDNPAAHGVACGKRSDPRAECQRSAAGAHVQLDRCRF